MVEGLEAPWFGLHLRRGNSLIGARRAVYSRDQVTSKAWLKTVPRDVPLSDMPDDVATAARCVAGSVHHFLLPAEGWGAAVDAKEAKALAPEAHGRAQGVAQVGPGEADQEAGRRARRARPPRRAAVADRAASAADRRAGDPPRIPCGERGRPAGRRSGHPRADRGRASPTPTAPTGASAGDGRLERAVVLAAHRHADDCRGRWRSEWSSRRPSSSGSTRCRSCSAAAPGGQEAVAAGQLTLGQRVDLGGAGDGRARRPRFAGASRSTALLSQHPGWSSASGSPSSTASSTGSSTSPRPSLRGGFDLQVGNPPWVRPRSDVDALLAEGDPWWQLAVKPTQARSRASATETLAIAGIEDLVVDGTSDVACTGRVRRLAAGVSRTSPGCSRTFTAASWSRPGGTSRRQGIDRR